MQIIADDRISMLADISGALADMRVSIMQINTQKKGADQMMINMGNSLAKILLISIAFYRVSNPSRGVNDIRRGYVK